MEKKLISFQQLIETLKNDPNLKFTREVFDVKEDGEVVSTTQLLLQGKFFVFDACEEYYYNITVEDFMANDWYIIGTKLTKEEIDKQFNEHLIKIKEALDCMLDLKLDSEQSKLLLELSDEVENYELKKENKEFSDLLKKGIIAPNGIVIRAKELY